MSWHAAGTYRIYDGRGGGGQGAQRFAPLNSWPDNANLDKARRLLWPVKQKYGNKISWADLLVFAGNCRTGVGRLQDVRLRLRPRGHLGARGDPLRPGGHLAGHRQALLRRAGTGRAVRRHHHGPDLRQSRRPRRQAGSAGRRARHPRDIRPDGDERRGDRRADRRRPHARQDPRRRRRRPGRARARGAPRSSSRAWAGSARSPPARPATRITSGLEVVWTTTPTQWGNGYLEILYGNEWELTKSPGWRLAVRGQGRRGDHPGSVRRPETRKPTMLVTDVSMRVDPIYGAITRRWLDHPEEMDAAFAKAWYKLLHRDMGPVSRYLGPVGRRAAAVAGPGARRRPRADRRGGHRGAEGQGARLRAVRAAAGQDGMVVGVELPRHRQAGRRQRCAAPP